LIIIADIRSASGASRWRLWARSVQCDFAISCS